MQYVRSLGGSVSKTWNSINPATLSGAIDVIVVEQEDGSLACSPFHVRFGKFSLLRPYEKRVEFFVNGVRQTYAMKLGEGGEAFFVFETSDQIPESLQTSPVISPSVSPHGQAQDAAPLPALQEPDFLDISTNGGGTATNQSPFPAQPSFSADIRPRNQYFIPDIQLSNAIQVEPDAKNTYREPASLIEDDRTIPTSSWATTPTLFGGALKRSASEELFSRPGVASSSKIMETKLSQPGKQTSNPKITRENSTSTQIDRSNSPPPISTIEAIDRARSLSEKLSNSNIPTRITDSGDLMLDMTGYKSSEDQALRAEAIARKILAEELEGNYDIGALIGVDEHGNLWIYSSEEAKFAARRRIGLQSLDPGSLSNDAIPSDAASDPGYRDDDEPDETGPTYTARHHRARSDGSPEVPIVASHGIPTEIPSSGDPNRNYAKTLRLTSEQLKALGLKPGHNAMSFNVNKATCQASMYYWTYDIPIVISDIDGTITKSDALGHVLNMIGRDWTHIGVAKLYTDIVANGYNILYLTSRSVGQADTTRAYLYGVLQEGFKLPKGPVIMSPDRTIAALRREIYLRKPEVFKMACLRDILNLFGHKCSPFYAGFGNRLTDALSYRSVNIPSTRIFTINSNAEVSFDLLTLNKYKNSYVTMRELVDHFFPPVGLLVTGGGDDFTDFNYWRDTPREVEDFSESDCSSEIDDQKKRGRASIRNEDEGSEGLDYDDQLDLLGESYISRDSIDDIDRSSEPVTASIESSGILHENRMYRNLSNARLSAAVQLDVSNLSMTNPELPNDPLHDDGSVDLE